jgi:tRNA (mo5U34)-methyltransferase
VSLATDHFAWSEECWDSRDSFELAREIRRLDIDALDVDLDKITPE